MSDTLIGVIVGALIASLAPIVNLLLERRRWKREALLEYLKSERVRLTVFHDRVIKDTHSALTTGSFPPELASDLVVFGGPDVVEALKTFTATEPKTLLAYDTMISEVSIVFRVQLQDVDEQIRAMLK